MIVCTVGSAFSSSLVRGFGVLTVLSIWRFFLGIGIGGDYPMSAIITSEFANVRYRGMMISAVFAMQGIGYVMGSVVMICALSAFKNQINNDVYMLDYVWRIMIGFGVIPALCAVYFRLTIPETPRYTVDVIGDEEKAEMDVARVLEMNTQANVTSNWAETEEAAKTERVAVKENTFRDFVAHFGQWKNAKVLIGAAYCWCALDIAWYGLSLNQSTILNLINYNGVNTATPFDKYYQKALGGLIINMMGTVPGYWVTVATIEKLGRKPIQLIGFAVITVCLFILAAMWNTLTTNNTTVFIVIYTIAQFFFNFGPNTTTFVIPGEVFPTRWRSTGHGLSAAAGKAGAIIGVQVIGPMFNSNAQLVLYIFGAVMASGFVMTFLLPETKGKTLEELSGDDKVIVA